MNESPNIGAAWQQDPFWREVVMFLADGKKLRGEHYLQGLSAEDLEALRCALSSPGTLVEQQKLCPPRKGGASDGSLPAVDVLSKISQAMRRVHTLRAMQMQDAIKAATQERCGQIGLDPQMTNAVCRIVGEEALRRQAENQVGDFAVSAANVLLMAEAMRTKGLQEEVKIELKKQAEERQKGKLKLDLQKFQWDAAEACRKYLPKLKAIAADKSLSERDRTQAFMETLFGNPEPKAEEPKA